MPQTRKKILIIEDDESLVKDLEIKLAQAGFKTKTAFNGIDGIELLKKESFSLIILGLIMPKMDGFTVLAILKVKKTKTPVIVFTNLNKDSAIRHAKEFGVKDFFVKSKTPVETIILRAKEILK